MAPRVRQRTPLTTATGGWLTPLAPSQSLQRPGAQTNYTYGYVSGAWTITATTTNSSGAQHWTTTILDGLGRTASVQTGTGSTTLSEVDTVYAPCACSPLGKMYQQSQPYAPPNFCAARRPLTPTTRWAAPSACCCRTAPARPHYTYQGNVTTVTDPAGNWKQYANDALGNLVDGPGAGPHAQPRGGPPTATDISGDQRAHRHLLTSYTYDQFNHLTQVSMPRTTGYGR